MTKSLNKILDPVAVYLCAFFYLFWFWIAISLIWALTILKSLFPAKFCWKRIAMFWGNVSRVAALHTPVNLLPVNMFISTEHDTQHPTATIHVVGTCYIMYLLTCCLCCSFTHLLKAVIKHTAMTASRTDQHKKICTCGIANHTQIQFTYLVCDRFGIGSKRLCPQSRF